VDNKKEKLYVHVLFCEPWINGYLSRGGDRWGVFRSELRKKLKEGLKGLSPCRLAVSVYASGSRHAIDSGYSVVTRDEHFVRTPPGSNAKVVYRAANEIVMDHMKAYTFRYENPPSPRKP